MSDLIRTSKKVFTFGVVVTTILWSLGVAALVPSAANADPVCPTLRPGDQVKVRGFRHIYAVNNNNQVMSFGSGYEYKSWRTNESYGGYISISDACYQTLASPSAQPLFVNFRPGSYVIKRQSSNDLYVVLPNNAKAKISQAAAQSLYGNSFVAKEVPVERWGSYVNSGADITEARAHEGMLVRKDGKVWYVAAGNVLREVTSSGMVANSFKSAFVRSVSGGAIDGYATGDQITAEVAAVADRTQSGGVSSSSSPSSSPSSSSSTSTVPTGSLSVALASDTPVAASIISDSDANTYPQSMIPFTSVTLSASASGPVKVTSLKFYRNGIANDSDLGNMYLYEGNTKVAEYNSFNNRYVTFSNSSGLVNLAAGASKTLTLKGDLSRGSTSVVAGKTIGFGIVAASDVSADGSISGSFPLNGNLMSTAAVSDLGHVYLASTSSPSTVKADDAARELFRFTATADSQNMQVRYVKFTVVGTISASDVRNLKLEVAGVQVASSSELASDKSVAFDLSGSPVAIQAGQSKIFGLRADMAGGSGRNLSISLQRSSDFVVYDTNYGVNVTPNLTNVTTAFSVLQGGTTSVDSGSLTIGVANDSPTGNIADNGTALTLAKFTFTAVGENVRVDSISVGASSTAADFNLKNAKLLLDGSQVGSTVATLNAAGYTTGAYSFGNTFVVNAGTARVLSVVADLTDSTVATGESVFVSLSAGSSNAVGLSTMSYISTAAQSGRTLTVRSGAVALALNSSFANRGSSLPNGTVNATDVKIGSFVITAGSGEAVDITQIQLADKDATTPLGEDFQNLKLKNGSTQIGATISSLNTGLGTYTFTPSAAIRVAAGQQYVVDLYADIKSSVTNSATNLTPVAVVDSVTATGVNTGASASNAGDLNLQQAYLTASGNLTIALDADSPVSTHLVMGQTDVSLAKFKLTTDASENIQISDFTLSVSTTAATGTIKNVKLFVDGVQVGPTVNMDITSVTSTFANANFSGLSLVIPRNNNKVVTVKADISSFDDMGGASTGNTYDAALLFNDGDGESITARGVSSGISITGSSLDYNADTDVNLIANRMTVYRTKVSVAWAGDSPSGSAVGGTGATVAKVVITNSANAGNYDATVKLMNFNLSVTGLSNTATRTLYVYKDSVISANQLATSNFPATGSAAQNFTNTSIPEGSFTDVNIAAGASKTFIVTLDTNEAVANNRLSVSVGASGVTWGDGSTASITSVPETLPLSAKTLSY